MQTNVLYEKIGRVALLTLNRPEKLNALDYATNDRLLSLLDAVEADEEIGAVILTGAEELFPAAFDLAERILRHSPLAAARIITAGTRGINTTIDEGLLIEREQFARMCPTVDVLEGLDAWIARRPPTYLGR